jgi:hypothetical protein
MHCFPNFFRPLSKWAVFYITILCCHVPHRTYAWGAWGHNHINKGAVLALPKEMGMFFYNHADFIVQESTVPDIRKYVMNDKAEGPRHYIRLEYYNYTTPASMPRTLADAQARFSKDSLDANGILPWHILDMMEKLTAAFKNKRKAEILLIAADLGHYIGDAHMPLHTTVNYDGQATNQRGIHYFWEGQLPELFGKGYNLCTSASYIDNIETAAWGIIDSSHNLVGRLLQTEYNMRKDNPEGKQYAMGPDGKPLKNKYNHPTHAYAYAHVYHELLGNMVETQMRSAIRYTASFWYTAWVNAGKPDLTSLDPEAATESNTAAYKQDAKAWKNGKVRGCGSDKEYPELPESKK